MNPSSERIITVASPSACGRWSTSKKKGVESETGLSLLARLETRPSVLGLEPTLIPDGPQPGDIIELSGTPGSGKSLMVLHLILSVLLPRTWKGVRLGGFGGGVIFIDTDIHFNILQLENMLQKKVSIILKNCKSVLKRRSGVSDGCDVVDSAEELNEFLRSSKQCFKEELNKLTKNCLKNFLYLRCSDSTQFAVTLLSANELFQNNDNVSLVVIDSISAFYWDDRSYRAGTWYKVEQYYNKIFKVFLDHIKKHKLVLVSTRQSLFEKKNNKDNYSYKRPRQVEEEDSEDIAKEYEFLGKEWANSVTCRIHLSITKSSILTIDTEDVGEYSLRHSPEPLKDVLKCHLTDSKEEIDPTKISNDRATYTAEVATKGRKTKLTFTIHEEGIRWYI